MIAHMQKSVQRISVVISGGKKDHLLSCSAVLKNKSVLCWKSIKYFNEDKGIK